MAQGWDKWKQNLGTNGHQRRNQDQGKSEIVERKTEARIS